MPSLPLIELAQVSIAVDGMLLFDRIDLRIDGRRWPWRRCPRASLAVRWVGRRDGYDYLVYLQCA
jgi:hypothetical protein